MASHRWQKGIKSPNPAGRPKKGTALTDCLRSLSDAKVNGERRKVLLAKKVFELALAGEQWACRLIWDRLEGLPVAATIKDENVRIEVSYVGKQLNVQAQATPTVNVPKLIEGGLDAGN